MTYEWYIRKKSVHLFWDNDLYKSRNENPPDNLRKIGSSHGIAASEQGKLYVVR